MFKNRFFKKKNPLVTQLKKIESLLLQLFKIRLFNIFLLLIILLFLIPVITFWLLKPEPATQITYGVTFSSRYAEEMGLDFKKVYLETLDDLKIKNLRLVAYWDEIEPVQDLYDFSNIEWQLEEAEKRDVKVILAFGQKVPRWPECIQPQWWKNIESPEVRQRELNEYITTIVKRFQKYNSIVVWQVENEPFWPFGECTHKIQEAGVAQEVRTVRMLDSRPILIQDSGEGGLWKKTYQLGDKLGISMYRKIWYDFWGIFFGKFIYFQYPLSHWSYKIKAELVGVPPKDIYVTELQAEPWGPGPNHELTQEQKNQTMSEERFLETINYAQKSGFDDLYFWGVEWWYYEKLNGNSYYWDTIKAIVN